MCFVYLDVSRFTCFLPRNQQDFCPSLARFYQIQSFREYLLSECSVQTRGVSTGCKEQEICLHGHCLEEPSMVMIKCIWTPVNFSTVFKFFMDSVPIYDLHPEGT